MQQSGGSKQWYAVQLRKGFEKLVAQRLRGKGYEEYLPTCRSRRHWSDRVKEIELPLFPGYIFCKFNVRNRLPPLLMIPGVRSILCFGGAPIPIPKHEIVAVQRVVKSGMQYGPWPGIGVGEAVQVKDGPLRGLEGVVVRLKRKDLLVISVSLLQQCVSVEIDRASLAPLQENRAEVGRSTELL